MVRLRLSPRGCRLAALKNEGARSPMPRLSFFYRLAAAALIASATTSVQAQTTIRIAKQFGISYLPLTIMEQKQLFEEHARRKGLDLKVEWVQLTSGAPMNEAILSGNLDF